jgi:hypothetical protein
VLTDRRAIASCTSGIVTAAGKEEAIQRACERFDIEPEYQRELVVREM